VALSELAHAVGQLLQIRGSLTCLCTHQTIQTARMNSSWKSRLTN
jgi:hypothetical protein